MKVVQSNPINENIQTNFSTPEERLKIVNQYIGFGNPNSNVWIFGSEEAGEWTCEEEIQSYKNVSYKNGTMGSHNKTYDGYFSILRTIFGNDKNYFISNLWPLGKKSRNGYSKNTKRLFGFYENCEDEQLLNSLKEDRFFALEMFFKLFFWKDKYIFFCTGDYFNIKVINEFFVRLTGNPKATFTKSFCNDVDVLTGFNVFNLYHASSPKFKIEQLECIKLKLICNS